MFQYCAHIQVTQFDLFIFAYEEVGWFDVPVYDIVCVQIAQTL